MDNREIMLNTQNEVTYTPQEEAIRNEATGLKNIVAKLEEINGKEQSFIASYFEGNNKIYVNRGFAYIRGYSVSDDKGSQFDLGVNQRALIYIKLNVTSAGTGNATISLEEVQQTDATSALQYLQNKNNKWSGPTHSGEWIIPICYYITNQNGEVIHYEDLRMLKSSEDKIYDLEQKFKPIILFNSGNWTVNQVKDLGVTKEEMAEFGQVIGRADVNADLRGSDKTITGIVRMLGAYESGSNGVGFVQATIEWQNGTNWKLTACTVTYSYNNNTGTVKPLTYLEARY